MNHPIIEDVKDIYHYSPIRMYLFFCAVVLVMLPTEQSLGFLKSIPDTPSTPMGYLKFQSPPKLRFHESEPLADRRKLLTLHRNNKDIKTQEILTTPVSDNSFPLVSYEEDQNNSSPVYVIPTNDDTPLLSEGGSLPPNDPFVPIDTPEPNLNNTDELMKILESGLHSSSRGVGSQIDFIPPYTLDGGNMIMESKTRYTRRTRQ